jgi:hypothetical protein
MNRPKDLISALVVAAAFVAVMLLSIDTANAQGSGLFQRTVYSAKFLCGEFQSPPGVCPDGTTCTSDADCLNPGETCDQPEGPVKPGNYQTAINVLNPTRHPVAFQKKAVLLFSNDPDLPVPTPGTFEEPQPPGNLFTAILEENWGMEIDCPDIREVLLGQPPDPTVELPFIKGFVVLETFTAGDLLNVVPAYTSHGFTPRVEFICVDGTPCDPTNPLDPCLSSGLSCDPVIVGINPEGFSIDIEDVEGTPTQ